MPAASLHRFDEDVNDTAVWAFGSSVGNLNIDGTSPAFSLFPLNVDQVNVSLAVASWLNFETVETSPSIACHRSFPSTMQSAQSVLLA